MTIWGFPSKHSSPKKISHYGCCLCDIPLRRSRSFFSCLTASSTCMAGWHGRRRRDKLFAAGRMGRSAAPSSSSSGAAALIINSYCRSLTEKREIARWVVGGGGGPNPVVPVPVVPRASQPHCPILRSASVRSTSSFLYPHIGTTTRTRSSSSSRPCRTHGRIHR